MSSNSKFFSCYFGTPIQPQSNVVSSNPNKWICQNQQLNHCIQNSGNRSYVAYNSHSECKKSCSKK